jgi:hypothetical protein
VAGSSVFHPDVARVTCLLNSAAARRVVEALNPTINFQVGDVARVPLLDMPRSAEVAATLERAFSAHEAAREPSVEFVRPGPSAWQSARRWAQRVVDDPATPGFEPVHEPPAPEALVSFAFGRVMGRFEAPGQAPCPHGILLLSAATKRDSLLAPFAEPLHRAWQEQGAQVGRGNDLRAWLRKSFFAWHKDTYEGRPIYLPLSSSRKTFVAFIAIHRWTHDTLQTLVHEYLHPERHLLALAIQPLLQAQAHKRLAELQAMAEELEAFIEAVADLADHGPPPVDRQCPRRQADASFAMELDDGVLVNAAALWPLLEPQWREPKKLWKELAAGQGRKHYDWAQVAARYFPERVDSRCKADPSLAAAHRRLWRHHPSKAYQWELRMREQQPEFTLQEPDSDERRAQFLQACAAEAAALRSAEHKRRARKLTAAAVETDA